MKTRNNYRKGKAKKNCGNCTYSTYYLLGTAKTYLYCEQKDKNDRVGVKMICDSWKLYVESPSKDTWFMGQVGMIGGYSRYGADE